MGARDHVAHEFGVRASEDNGPKDPLSVAEGGAAEEDMGALHVLLAFSLQVDGAVEVQHLHVGLVTFENHACQDGEGHPPSLEHHPPHLVE